MHHAHPHTVNGPVQRPVTSRGFVRSGLFALLVCASSLTVHAGQASDSVIDQALHHLRDHSLRYGLSPQDVAALTVTDAYRSDHNGVNHVYVRQQFDGLPVVNAVANLNLDDNGRLHNLHSSLQPDLASRAGNRAVNVTAAQAIIAAARHLDIPLIDSPLARQRGATQSLYSGGSLSQDPIPVNAVYYVKNDRLHRAWDLVIRPYRGSDWWHLWVDATDGRILDQVNWTADASYNVFALPLESPADGPRSVQTDVHDPVASPFGWHDTDGVAGAEFTDTRGNNVSAQEDTDANNTGGRRPDGGVGLVFDFPLDLNTQQPPEYEDFAITNLFYWNNIVHDVLYHYGFDEAAGNFQENNYGNGGVGGDAVRAEAQDGSGTNNANFSTPPDGGSGRMQMFIFTPPATLQITAPANIAADYAATPASFGATIDSVGVSGSLTLVDDGSGNPSEGCNPLQGFPAGNIAVIDRGTCEFGIKALNAENAGASAVIVVNNQAGNDTITMGPGAVGNQVTIAAAMIGNDDGNTIRAEFGQTVSGTLSLSALNRDSDLDAGVIVHEYGHGVSNRLTGGPSNASCLFGSQQAGEGWSDFLTLVFNAAPGDTADTPRGLGGYVSFREDDPLATIRPAPYSRDMAINSLTYGDIITAGQPGSNISIPHGVGTVFATALWDMYWNLVDRHGYDADLYNGNAGNQLALQLVLDGMKLQPCGPTFLDARDAILMADQVNNGGNNQCEIWQAFARRGMGFSADDGGSSNTLAVTPAFDLPESCGEILLADGFEAPL